MKNKFGFTLAEVLITLGIIGVVAALTMPVLTEKVNNIIMVNKLKKMYSVMSQAMMFTAAKDGDYNSLSVSNSDFNSLRNIYLTTLKPQFKITKECFDTAGCWAKETKTLGNVYPYCYRQGIGIGYDIVVFNTSDGYNVIVDAYGYSTVDDGRLGVKIPYKGSDVLVVYVDVNGYNNPNVIGKDTFLFVFTPEIGFVPAGRDLDDAEVNANCSTSDKTNMGSQYCFEKLIRNNWKIDKDFYK